MKTKLGLNRTLYGAHFCTEDDTVEFWDHLTRAKSAEVAAIAAGWATGMLTGKLAEVGAVLNLAFEVFAGFLAVDQDMPRLC